MKVHRIITTIEIENDDNHSITTVELTKLELDDIYSPVIVTNINTTSSSKDIVKLYSIINDYRLDINNNLKCIADYINNALDDCKRGMK